MGKQLRRYVPLFCIVGCWFLLTACPCTGISYSLFNYLPADIGNSWIYGCNSANSEVTAEEYVANEGMSTQFKIMSKGVVNNHSVWLVENRDSLSLENENFQAYYFFYQDGVMYYTLSLDVIRALPELTTPATNTTETLYVAYPFVHLDLTPRTITDATDPLVIENNGNPVRYVRGAFADFFPMALNPYINDGSLTIESFAAGVQGWEDCIALEKFVPTEVKKDEGEWYIEMIFGRDLGPMMIDWYMPVLSGDICGGFPEIIEN